VSEPIPPHRVLVVDDAMTVRLYHGKLLADAGWQVSEAGNGVEALEKTLAQPADAAFDLYVVDVNMPKMDGYSFVRALRRAELPQAPVLMVSTEAQVRDSAAAFDAGANGYFIKPVPRDDLLLTAALLLGDAPAAARAAARAAEAASAATAGAAVAAGARA
jgi:two-component system chemotaxis response regulator CheY